VLSDAAEDPGISIFGNSKSGMSKTRFSVAWSFAFGGLVFTLTFISASLTGFHPFKRSYSQQQRELRPRIFRGNATPQKRRSRIIPNFHRDQVLPWITA
jgi:hypothetical protein